STPTGGCPSARKGGRRTRGSRSPAGRARASAGAPPPAGGTPGSRWGRGACPRRPLSSCRSSPPPRPPSAARPGLWCAPALARVGGGRADDDPRGRDGGTGRGGCCMSTEEFTRVAAASEIPEGTFKAVDVGGEKVVIANAGGTFCAFSDVCTHDEGPLSEGSL